MRSLLFFCLILLLASCENGEKALCHDASATEDFAALGKDKAFQNAHESPTLVDSVRLGEMIEQPVKNGEPANAYFVKNEAKKNAYLFLLHEWWGLNENIKREADLWSKELNVNVLALDLYDGKSAETAEKATELMQANKAERSEAIIRAYIDFAGEGAEIQTMGWCFGGGWSLQSALLAGEKAKSCVVYYGMPEMDKSKLSTLQAPVVFIHPNKDKWITEEVVGNFEKTMAALGKSVQVYHYEADHAFANPSSPRYNEAAAKEARAVVTAFLKEE